MHMHPKQMHHSPTILLEPPNLSLPSQKPTCTSSLLQQPYPVQSSADEELSDKKIPLSLEESFTYAAKIATLAERFGLTRFKDYQKKAADNVISGGDTIVVQPTGSVKSLCFQFPAVHENKKVIVVTPSISLMHDQVQNLLEKRIPALLLGSVQLDKSAED